MSTLVITQVKSANGTNGRQRDTLRSLGLHTSIAIIGFDDFELADLLAMPTTVVRHDSQELGRHAAELAFMRLDGRGGPPRHVVVPTELVTRGSGEVRPR